MDTQYSPSFFAGPYIDRRSEVREAPSWLADARADPRTRYLVARGTGQLVRAAGAEGAERRIAFLAADHPWVRAAAPEDLVLLGWFHDAPCVLVELGASETPSGTPCGTPAGTLGLPEGTAFEELRPLSSRMARDEAGLLAYARALSIWRQRNRFCGVCGSPTRPERAGHMLRCSRAQCAREIFPRIEPAIIVLVTDGERALLGRQPSWPPGRYSTIAGFVEPGESLEDAVHREVREETGVQVARVEYHSSQPWPFPASLMLGFQALAAPGARIELGGGGELEDVRWFSRAQLASGTPLLPPPHAISFALIAAWFDAGSSVSLATLRS